MQHPSPLFNASLCAGVVLTLLVSLGSFATAQTCVQPPDGIVGWWPGDGNAGDIIGGNDGTPVGGVVFPNAEVAQGFSFDGVNDYVRIPHNADLDITSSGFTVEFWMKGDKNQPPVPPFPPLTPFSGINSGFTLVDKSHRPITVEQQPDHAGWVFRENGNFAPNSGRVCFLIGVGPSCGWPSQCVAGACADNRDALTNTWRHIAGTYDGISTVRLYVDGAIVGEGFLFAFDGLFNNTRDLHIGSWNHPDGGGATNFFNGQVDELSIYQRALSPAEIAAIFAAGHAGKCKDQGPSAAFTFAPEAPKVEETITFDASPSTGQIVNFAWDFGDGNITEGQVVTHAYTAAGAFTVTLTVTDDDGLTDSVSQVIEVACPCALCSISQRVTQASTGKCITVEYVGQTDCNSSDSGFDATNAATDPWLSVAVGQTTQVAKAMITPEEKAGDVHFQIKSDTRSIAAVSPPTASSSSETLQVTGITAGIATIEALVDGNVLGSLNVAVYEKKTLTVAVFIITPEKRDGQPKGKECKKPDPGTTQARLQTGLNNIWDQAAVQFTVKKFVEKKVDFDLDTDCRLDAKPSGSREKGPEEEALVNAIKDRTADINVYFVKALDAGFEVGLTVLPDNVIFIQEGHSQSTVTLMAHEIGHVLGLDDITDVTRLMHDGVGGGSGNNCFLTKPEWDTSNATAATFD